MNKFKVKNHPSPESPEIIDRTRYGCYVCRKFPLPKYKDYYTIHCIGTSLVMCSEECVNMFILREL